MFCEQAKHFMDGEYDHLTQHLNYLTVNIVTNIITNSRETQKSFSGVVRDSNPLPSVENLHHPTMANYLIFINKTEAVVWRCSVKKVFLKISQNSREKTYSRVSF